MRKWRQKWKTHGLTLCVDPFLNFRDAIASGAASTSACFALAKTGWTACALCLTYAAS